jgi:tetratricopeptide (TPR) repeat protein
MRSWLVVASALTLLASTSPAAAQGDVKRAKKLFQEAEKHFADGQYEQALEKYRGAYKAKPLPGFQFNIGQCLRSLGRLKEAIHHFEQYIELSERPRHRADAERLIKLCKEDLAARSQQDKEDEQPPDIREEAREGAPIAPEAPPPKPEKERNWRVLKPIFLWSSMGVAAAFLITGSITGGVALGKSREFKDKDTPYEDLRDLKDSGESMRTASNVSFGLAAAFGAVSVALYFLTDFSSEEAAVAAAPLREGGGMVTMGGRF